MKEGVGLVEKNSYHDVTFVDMTHDAMGVCRVEGFPLFVKGALKGEKATIKVIKVNKNFGFGRLIELKEASPFRKQPICDHFAACGGCDTMHMSYEMQLQFKRHRVQETLRKLGGIEVEVEDTIPMTNPYYYRNKALVPFGVRGGRTVAGLYRPRSHDIVDIQRCHIYPRVFTDIIRFVRNVLQEQSTPIYQGGKGPAFRGLMLRRSAQYGEISIVLIATREMFPGRDVLVKRLLDAYQKIVSIVVSVNPDKTNVMLGKKSRTLHGKDNIRDRLFGFEYNISHRSFYQVNPTQTEALYRLALEFASLHGEEFAVDVYSGIGTLTLPISRRVREAHGIESVPEATQDARRNAEANQVENVTFHTGQAKDLLPTLVRKADVVFLDPPRKGCEREVLDAIIDSNISRVVYVSCNVSTQARDAARLVDADYRVRKVRPVDMFPQTSHIETVMLLEKE